MKLASDFFLTGRHLPFFDTESDSGGSESESESKTDEQKDEGKGDEQKSDDDGVKRELRARANRLQQERDDLLKEKTAREAADKKRQEDADKEAGKHQELAERMERERDAAIQERDTLKDQNTKLLDAVNAILEDEWKNLPDEVKDVYPGSDEDDPLKKLGWLPKARKLVERLNGSEQQQKDGNKPNPPPRHGRTTGDDDSVRKRNASRYSG